MAWKYIIRAFCLLCLGTILLSCGSGIGSPQASIFTPAQHLSVSSWGTNGLAEQPFAAPRASFVDQSCLTCIGMKAPSCTLHSGSTPMNFTAAPSANWFAVSPITGAIPANNATQVGLSYINADGLPAANTGKFIVTAPGYEDNTQLSFTFTCGIYAADGTEMCQLALICPPCTLNSNGSVTCPW